MPDGTVIYQFGLAAWVHALAAVVGIGTTLLLEQRRNNASARWLALAELCAAIWAMASAFEVAATEVHDKVFWSQVSYIGIAYCPFFFYVFARTFAGQGRRPSSRLIMALAAGSFLTLLMAATNNWHRLLWPTVTVDAATNLGIYGRGPYFWVNVAFTYSLLALGFATIWRMVLQSSSFFRSQMVMLMAATAVPIIANFVYISGLNPIPYFDWTPVSLTLTGAMLAYGVLRLRLLDLVPVARDLLMDTMGEAVLLMDDQGRVADANLALMRLLGTTVQLAIGRPVGDVTASWPDLATALAQRQPSGDLALHDRASDSTRWFDLRLVDLSSVPGSHRQRAALHGTGTLAVLREITARRELEDQRDHLITELKEALAQVKTLSGLLPICASCKKIRDDQGYWHGVEAYLWQHAGAEFSHGVCPDCMKKLYPELLEDAEAEPTLTDAAAPDIP